MSLVFHTYSAAAKSDQDSGAATLNPSDIVSLIGQLLQKNSARLALFAGTSAFFGLFIDVIASAYTCLKNATHLGSAQMSRWTHLLMQLVQNVFLLCFKLVLEVHLLLGHLVALKIELCQLHKNTSDGK